MTPHPDNQAMALRLAAAVAEEPGASSSATIVAAGLFAIAASIDRLTDFFVSLDAKDNLPAPGPKQRRASSTSAIRTGAAVRDKASGRLGRTFRNSAGNIRGHLFVQWDGDRDRQTVCMSDVTFVAAEYETAKAWETAEAAGQVSSKRGRPS